jgi:hypothetical protein
VNGAGRGSAAYKHVAGRLPSSDPLGPEVTPDEAAPEVPFCPLRNAGTKTRPEYGACRGVDCKLWWSVERCTCLRFSFRDGLPVVVEAPAPGKRSKRGKEKSNAK